MKELMKIEEQNRMSSREIARLTNKEHKNVLADIRKMFNGVGIGGLKSQPAEYIDAQGKKRPEYLLDHEMTMTLITGYSVKLRNAVIKRWRELELGNAPKTYIEALEQLLAAEKLKQQLQIRLDENMEWYTVKRVKGLGLIDGDERTLWRPLKRYSLDNGYEMPIVPDVNYPNGVKSYHKDVWERVYDIELEGLKT